jgi:hypothetical protein
LETHVLTSEWLVVWKETDWLLVPPADPDAPPFLVTVLNYYLDSDAAHISFDLADAYGRKTATHAVVPLYQLVKHTS